MYALYNYSICQQQGAVGTSVSICHAEKKILAFKNNIKCKHRTSEIKFVKIELLEETCSIVRVNHICSLTLKGSHWSKYTVSVKVNCIP